MIGLAKKIWIPIVIVIVVVIAGFTVHRMRTFFGAEGIIVTPKIFADDPEPFNPKVVKYEIFGIGHLRRHQLPRPRRQAAARRRRRAAVDADAAARPRRRPFPNIVAQGDGDSHQLPHHRRRRGQGREDLQRRERPDLLLGEVRMSTPDDATRRTDAIPARQARQRGR